MSAARGRGPAPGGVPAAGEPACGSVGVPGAGEPACGSIAGVPGAGEPACGSVAGGVPAAGEPACGSIAGGSARRERLAWLWWRLRGGEARTRGAAARLGASVAVGLFIGALPLFGLHLPLCLALCLPLGLDVVVAYAAAQISNPLIAPALVAFEAEVGFLLLTGAPAPFDPARYGPRELAGPLAVGAPVVGLALALLGGAGAALVATLSRARPPARPRLDLGRTLARYASLPQRVRGYVTGKLLADPALDWLLSERRVRGRLVDLGCGHGQLGLALLDAGAVTALHGVDHDEARVAVAARAAAGDARFEAGALEGLALPEADCVILVDVLHYLPTEGRRAALANAAGAVAPGGALLLRVPGTRGLGAWLTRRVDVVLRRLGAHRGATVAHVSERELSDALSAAGLSVELRHTGSWLAPRHLVVTGERRRAAGAE